MNRGDAADVPGTGSREFDRIISERRAWLAERGEMVVGSGCFSAGPFSGSIHSDYGPPEQDKPVNQDYALAWWPKENRRPAGNADRRPPRLVLALADGLTNSYRSEWAAALACWIAVSELVEAGGGIAPRSGAVNALNAAGHALGLLADELIGDPEASCPEGQFLSTWKYILKKGAIFQTTLTLAWLSDERFYVAMLGDGGALWRSYGVKPGSRPSNDRVLAACDLESQQVNALGPAQRSVGELDCWHEQELDGPFMCALFTDGVGRGIGRSPQSLMDDLEVLEAASEGNAARGYIERAIRERPKDFDDNVTLAVVRG